MGEQAPGHYPPDAIEELGGRDYLDRESSARFNEAVEDTPMSVFRLGDLPLLVDAAMRPLVPKEAADLIRRRIAEFEASQPGQVPPTGDNSSEGGK